MSRRDCGVSEGDCGVSGGDCGVPGGGCVVSGVGRGVLGGDTVGEAYTSRCNIVKGNNYSVPS